MAVVEALVREAHEEAVLESERTFQEVVETIDNAVSSEDQQQLATHEAGKPAGYRDGNGEKAELW